MKSSENFDELLKALGNISFHLFIWAPGGHVRTSREMLQTRLGSPGRCYRTVECKRADYSHLSRWVMWLKWVMWLLKLTEGFVFDTFTSVICFTVRQQSRLERNIRVELNPGCDSDKSDIYAFGRCFRDCLISIWMLPCIKPIMVVTILFIFQDI